MGKGGGSVELRSVSFRYPARPEVQVFHQFSLKVEPGRSLALVGQSGSGKSTVISLVERFYDAEAGQVSMLPPACSHGTTWQKWARSAGVWCLCAG